MNITESVEVVLEIRIPYWSLLDPNVAIDRVCHGTPVCFSWSSYIALLMIAG